jgi:hypothetical protein
VNFVLLFLLLAGSMFAAILLMMEIGRRTGIRRRKIDPDGATEGTGAVEGAVFGLMGLLIAFTFSGAAVRFDERRRLIVQEANAIGTAYLRLSVLPPAAQPVLREKFRQYVDARLAVYRRLPDIDAAKSELRGAAALQQEIWVQAAAACQQASSPAVMTVVLSALNEMIDITTTRTVALETHPPAVVPVMLTVLVLACSLLAGYGMAGSRTRNWLHILGFATMLTFTIYVIIDLEYPRAGIIRIDYVDRVLMDLRANMK